jgi:hypothetical protein
MIGLSVSLCFRDMAMGKVDPASVTKVVGRTAARDQKAWNYVISCYRKAHWGEDMAGDTAEALLRKFLAEGKVYQPRLDPIPQYPVYDTHWVESEDQVQLEDW